MADTITVSHQFIETAVMYALFVTRAVDEDGDDFALYMLELGGSSRTLGAP